MKPTKYISISACATTSPYRCDSGYMNSESHYYPFGLTMAGISSKAMNSTVENKYRFNAGTELNTTFDISLYETMFRSYDPQLGRFHQTDPPADGSSSWSGYSFVQNNPLLYADPLGLDTMINGQFYEWNGRPLDEVKVFGLGNYRSGNGGYWYTGLFGGNYNPSIDPLYQSWQNEQKKLNRMIGGGGNAGEDNRSYVGVPVERAQQQNEEDWTKNTADIFGAIGLGSTLKTEMIDFVVRDYNGLSRKSFKHLSNYSKTVREVRALGTSGTKYLRYSKGIGAIGNVVGVTSAGVQLMQNPTAGNATKLAIQGVAIGAVFIPVVGWGVSIGIGVADLIWGDNFYKWIDKH